MKKLFVFAFCATMLASCGVLWVYRELHEMPQMTWKKSDIQHFEAEIKGAGNYDVTVLFRHVHGFPYKDVGMELNFSWDGEDLTESFIVPVIGDDREYLGAGSVDIWDVEYPVLQNYHFEPGMIAMELSHLMSKEELELVMEVGVKITKPEK